MHYITSYEVFIHIDHSNISLLMNKPITSGRITRWLLLLREFNITIIDRHGKENLVAYFLSMIHNESENIPEEHLFFVSTKSPWLAYIENYFSMGKLPQHLSSGEKQHIVKISATYSWIRRDLLCTRQDIIIIRCVWKDKMFDILRAFHDEPCGGNFDEKMTAYKVLHQGYYWLMLFKDVKKYVRSCDKYQQMGRLVQDTSQATYTSQDTIFPCSHR
jgi:hypothetical protein